MEQKTAAIVLAAGMSQRMGCLKMLLPFGDRPMLVRVVESLRDRDEIGPILVVTGHAAQEIDAAIGEYTGVQRVHNPDYADGGMLSSVKTGVRALPEDLDAFFLVLGDQPMVRPETLRRIRAAWHANQAPIVIPTFAGKRGHPVLIAQRYAEEILALPAEATLKSLMQCHTDRVQTVDCEDPAAIMDVDTPEDYARALARWQQATGAALPQSPCREGF